MAEIEIHEWTGTARIDDHLDLRRFLAGDPSALRDEEIARLADALGMDLDEVWGGEAKPKPKRGAKRAKKAKRKGKVSKSKAKRRKAS